MSSNPDELAAEVERTRERLGETVQELAAKADVKARAQEKAAELTHAAREKTTHAAHAVHDAGEKAREKAEKAGRPALAAAVVAGAAATAVTAVAAVRRRRRPALRRIGPFTVKAPKAAVRGARRARKATVRR
jgi:hypothetical protein